MQMSRLPVSSARSASTIPCRSEKVWPKTSRPQPRSRTTSCSMPCSWCSDGSFHDRLVRSGVEATGVRRRWPASRGAMTISLRPLCSYAVGLQPELQQAKLPELVAAQRGELPVGVGQQLVDVLRAEQTTVAGGVAGEGVPDQAEHLALQVGDRRHREVALRAVDDLRRD